MSIVAKVSTQDGYTVVALHGELDMFTAAEVRPLLIHDPSLTSGSLLVDLSEVTFLDSSGLGLLVATYKRVAARGERLALVCPENLRRIFQITGLDSLFIMHGSMSEVVPSLM